MKVILRIVNGKMAGEYCVLTEGSTHTIGRSGEADWAVIDDQISRLHCVIWVRDRRVFLRDFGSRNGTFLGEMQLPPGDRTQFADPTQIDYPWMPGVPLIVGDTHIELVLEQQPDAERPAIKITTPGVAAAPQPMMQPQMMTQEQYAQMSPEQQMAYQQQLYAQQQMQMQQQQMQQGQMQMQQPQMQMQMQQGQVPYTQAFVQQQLMTPQQPTQPMTATQPGIRLGNLASATGALSSGPVSTNTGSMSSGKLARPVNKLTIKPIPSATTTGNIAKTKITINKGPSSETNPASGETGTVQRKTLVLKKKS